MKFGCLDSLLTMISILICSRAPAMEQVFSFSHPAQASRWKIVCQQMDIPILSKRFGLYGGYSLRFASPAWLGNMPKWPACEAKPERKDWTGFDRLVIDLTNPGKGNQFLAFFVSDSKVPFRSGFSGSCTIHPKSSRRFVFNLNHWPRHVKREDISNFHLYTSHPGTDMEVFISSIFLLRPNEPAPLYTSSFMQEQRELYKPKLMEGMNVMQKVMDELMRYEVTPELEGYLSQSKKEMAGLMSHVRHLLTKPDITMTELRDMQRLMANCEKRPQKYACDMKLLQAAQKAGQDISQMAVAVASTMTKVMPQEVGFRIETASSVDLALAQNEYEGAQIVVMAPTENLADVRVTMSDIKNSTGQELTAEVDVVGFVKTKNRPPNEVNYIGWWPDPILRGPRQGAASGLSQCKAVSVKLGNSQAFWLRFKASKKQTPGTYTGTVTVTAKGVKPVRLPVNATVYPFQLPAHTPLPTAMSFDFPTKLILQKKQPLKTMRLAYADFLADYLVNWDNIYRQKEPDWDILTHLHKQGRLTAFNLGNVFNAGMSKKNLDRQLKQTLDRLRIAYDKAKDLGLLEHAYIYGFDERGKSQFPMLEQCAQTLHNAFPKALIMTTSFDYSYGMESIVKTMQAWCPSTPNYNLTKADAARKSGRQVWWYICCGPHHPYMNWLIEHDAIEARLLMGAAAAKYKPDGFLYYAMTIWNDNTGLDCDKGPFTTWNPVSWTVYHGDGSLMYCDKDGYPLPSIRLENYRDGLEDYAYACILQEAIRKTKNKKALKTTDRAWLKEAEAALAIPAPLIRSLTDYTRDPQVVLGWRQRMAQAIEKSGMKDLNPWPKVFGPRSRRTILNNR